MATNLIPQTRLDLAEILRRHDSIPKLLKRLLIYWDWKVRSSSQYVLNSLKLANN